MRYSSKRHSCRHKLAFDSLEMRSLLAAAGASAVAHTAAGENPAAAAGRQHTAAISTMDTHIRESAGLQDTASTRHARVRIHRAAITAKDDAIVTTLYERILHRSPAAADLQFWDGRLAQGLSEKSVARAIANSSGAHRLSDARHRTGLPGIRTAATGTTLTGTGPVGTGATLADIATGTGSMLVTTDLGGTSPTVVGTSTGAIGVGTTQASTGTVGSGTTLTGSGSTGTGTELPGARSLGTGMVVTGTGTGTRGAGTTVVGTATTGLATTGSTVTGTTGPGLFGTGTIGTVNDGTSFIDLGTTGGNVSGADTLGAETSVIRTGFTPTPGALSAIASALLPLGIADSATDPSLP